MRGYNAKVVSCITPSFCEVAGRRFNPHVANSDRTLAELYNGHRWTGERPIDCVSERGGFHGVGIRPSK